MTATHDIVQKLWNLCNLLRDDGVTYMQYVTELTYLLFLKLLQEQEQEAMLPEGYRWDDLKQVGEPELIKFYKELLEMLGEDASQPKMQAIFVNAQSSIKKPTILKKLVTTQPLGMGETGNPMNN
jgi:type I restriction enzyme M protein